MKADQVCIHILNLEMLLKRCRFEPDLESLTNLNVI